MNISTINLATPMEICSIRRRNLLKMTVQCTDMSLKGNKEELSETCRPTKTHKISVISTWEKLGEALPWGQPVSPFLTI